MPDHLVPPTDPEERRLEPAMPPAGAVAQWPSLPRREPEGADLGTSVRRYWATVYRYKWLVVLATALGVGVGVFAMRSVRPQYLAQATIWVESPAGRGGPIQAEQLLRAREWAGLLTSYQVLDEAVRRLLLFVVPVAAGDSAIFRGFGLANQFATGKYVLRIAPHEGLVHLFTEGGRQIESVPIGDSIGRSVGFAWSPSAEVLRGRDEVGFLVMHPRDAAVRLGKALNIPSVRGEGNFLRVELSGTDRVRITATVNAVVERFVEVAADQKRDNLTELVRILGEQLRGAETNLRRAENAMETFRIETITLPQEEAFPIAPGLSDTRALGYRDFFDMRVELDAVRRDRVAIERALRTDDAASATLEGLSAVAAVQRSPDLQLALQEHTRKRAELRALLYRYTEEHPQVRRLSEELRTLERKTIPDVASALVAELTLREADLGTLLGSASQELRQIPPRKIQEARLARDVQIADNIYKTLQQRYEEARLGEASSIPDVRVFDPAVVPQRPTSDLALKVLVAGVALGIALGIGGAVVLDRFDRRVRDPEQITEQMGLEILGVVPYLKSFGKGGRPGNGAPAVEALRGIRLNLLHSYGTAGPLVVGVTSPGSGDGKSFVASNLALSFADAGHRTLLVDADTRRGALHRVLKASRKPGLTDLLATRVELTRAVQQTNYPLLHFLGSGTRLAAAPELLGSAEMMQLLATLRRDYGVILVDCPPLGAGVDAFALGTMTGNLLIVLRTGKTNQGVAEAKLDMLERLPVRIVGAVLNGAKEARGYGYYSYYMPGYEHESEEDPAMASSPSEMLVRRKAD